VAIAQYTDLTAAVANWLFGRTDLVARIPEFITLCEAKLNRTLFCRQMEARSTVTLNPLQTGPEFVTLPFDFQTMRRVRVINTFSPSNPTGVDRPRLRFATGAQMDDLRENNTAPGVPIWFTIFGTEMEVLPTPDQAYPVEMVYRQNLPALNTTPTINGIIQPLITANWLLSFAPDAYLYGTLMQAAPFLRDNENIPIWKGLLDTAVSELNELSEKANYNAGPLVMRRRRGY
jgi:hypothetical protein